MASGTTVVFGATGRVGGVIAERLLGAGRAVRVVARSAEKLAALGQRGAEVVPGDVTDAAFVRRATSGAAAAFVLIPPYLGAGLRAYADRVVAALADGVAASRVGHVVTLSSLGADQERGTGPIARLHELEGRLDRIPGLHRLHLRPGYFFHNHLGAVGMIRQLGFYGGALREDAPIPHIDPRDIGEAAARRLLALDWTGGEVLELHGPRDLSPAEVTAILGRAIGKPDLRYVAFSYPDARKGMLQAGLPEDVADAYNEMSQGLNEGLVRPLQPRSARTTTPTTFEDWAERVFAPAFRA